MNKRIKSTDAGLLDVIREAFIRGFSVKGNFAREHADYVAMAASLALLTTKVSTGIFSREWRPTTRGMMYMTEMGEGSDE